MLRKSILLLLAFCVAVLAVAPASAQPMQRYAVTITNVTGGQIFSPPLVVSHEGGVALFRAGQPALPELAELAEDGNPNALAALLDGSEGVFATAIAEGPIMPGQSATVEITLRSPYTRISAVGMLVTTNDAFFALNGVQRPVGRRVGVHTANAYDAGSEANTESCEHIPGPPCGNGGVRVEDGAEGFVYISPGIQGVGDLTGASDWRNPVARIYIQRVR